MKLEEGIVALRDQHVDWDSARAERVLAGAKSRRERAARQSQLVRRSLVGVATAAAVVVVLLRGGAAPAGEREIAPETIAAQIAPAFTPSFATAAAGDGEGGNDAGYARD
jgi:hypothetical protein